MIQQGRNQRALLAEAQSYVARNGMTALYRGFVSIKACAFLLSCQIISHDSGPLMYMCCQYSIMCHACPSGTSIMKCHLNSGVLTIYINVDCM